MKTLKVALPVIASALVIAPYFTGKHIEEKTQASLAAIPANPQMQITLDNYNRGWFSSDASVTVTTVITPEESFNMTFDISVGHGPIYVTDRLGFGLAGWYTTLSEDVLNHLTDNALRVTKVDTASDFYASSGNLSFLGNINYVDSFTAFELSTADDSGNPTIRVNGYEGEGTVAGKHIEYQGNLSSISIEKLDSVDKVSVEDIGITASIQGNWEEYISGQLVDSSFALVIGSITNTDKTFSLSNLGFGGDVVTVDNGEKANIGITYHVDGIQTEALALEGAKLALSLNNMSKEFYDFYARETQALVNKAENIEVVNEEINALLVQGVNLLLAGSPEARIDTVYAKVGESEFDMNAKASIDLNDGQQLTMQDIENPLFWKQALNVKVDGVSDEAFFVTLVKNMVRQKMAAEGMQLTEEELTQAAQQQVGMFVGMLEAQSFVRREEGKLLLNLALDNGQATSHGEMVILPL